MKQKNIIYSTFLFIVAKSTSVSMNIYSKYWWKIQLKVGGIVWQSINCFGRQPNNASMQAKEDHANLMSGSSWGMTWKIQFWNPSVLQDHVLGKWRTKKPLLNIDFVTILFVQCIQKEFYLTLNF